MRRVLVVAAVVILIAVAAGAFFLYRSLRDVGDDLQQAGESLGNLGDRLQDTVERLGGAEAKGVNPCKSRIPFKPTKLPRGWKRAVQCGDPSRTGGVVTKQRGTHGVGFYEARVGFIYVVRGEWSYAQSRSKRIKVLGSPATLGDIHEGFSTEFEYKGKKWALVAYTGPLPRKEFETFVKGLRPY